MFKVRENEPDYAIIPNVEVPEKSQHGTPIQLVDETSELFGKSLNINGDAEIGDNPNRYKQHGFHFTADNCIACHACESACSEKNDLPAHISFRSVGYVEGGTYPAYQRMNISMACNHCEDPVCLKGCPTRAYTKYAEYGAVLQDPDICFGCGYCTWVCPYNAPQLDLEKGQVSKCNMCVDRLEVGLKPACASACLGGALDFGVIESKPENRIQAKLEIPGFPTPDITRPNIRFQQTRSLPKEMTRPDTMPIRYTKEEAGEADFKVRVRHKGSESGKIKRGWNFKKLSSREDPLVLFTLISQGVIGAFLLLFLGPMFGLDMLSVESHPVTNKLMLVTLLVLEGFALGISTMHLGKPHRFYRAFNNLRYSPVSREVASLAVFYTMLGGYTVTMIGLFNWLPHGVVSFLSGLFGWLAVISGPVALYAMHKIYRIKARPFWNHWQVLSSFYGTMFTLGALWVGLVFSAVLLYEGSGISELMVPMAWLMALGLVLEGIGLFFHARYLEKCGNEAAASHWVQRTTFGYTYVVRNIGLAVSLFAALAGAVVCSGEGIAGFSAWLLLGVVIMATMLVGRALFYVLVIPTTMPGAFFWRNAGFQEQARESGLAEMPQVGVLPHEHYQEEALARAAKELKEDFKTIKKQGLVKSLEQLKENMQLVIKNCFS